MEGGEGDFGTKFEYAGAKDRTTTGMIAGVKGVVKSKEWSWRGSEELWVIHELPAV
jgi:hypothetical protein